MVGGCSENFRAKQGRRLQPGEIAFGTRVPVMTQMSFIFAESFMTAVGALHSFALRKRSS